MAVAARKSVVSLMQKTLDRQEALSRLKFKFNKNQVEHILLSYIHNGNVSAYNDLLKVLQNYPLNDDNFHILIEDSLSCVVLLGKDCSQFVELVCGVEWASRSQELVELFNKFVMNVVTAHSYHCPNVMSSLLKFFKVDGENWDDSPPAEKIAIWSNIHTIIAQIVATIPMTSAVLIQTVLEEFPYYKASCYINRVFVHNLIWMSKYIPLLQEQIVTVIISRMVLMDVNIVENSKNKMQTEIFEMDIEQENSVSETLDYCMLEILKWLEDERDTALSIFCNVFEKVILPTHGIR